MELEIVTNVAGAFSAWQDEESFPFQPRCCVNGTRVATRVLRRFGIKAKPVSVHFVLFNQQALQLWRAGVPVEEWPSEAWSLGVGPENMSAGGGVELWPGHLVAEGNGWTLDVSARQFHRPGRLTVDEPLVFDFNLPHTGGISTTDSLSQTLMIARWPDNNGWRQAPGWKRAHEAEVDELFRRTLLLLNERNQDEN